MSADSFSRRRIQSEVVRRSSWESSCQRAYSSSDALKFRTRRTNDLHKLFADELCVSRGDGLVDLRGIHPVNTHCCALLRNGALVATPSPITILLRSVLECVATC